MNFKNSRLRIDILPLGFFLLITFFVHLLWVFYVASIENLNFIESIRNTISENYSVIGFRWNGVGSYLLTAALVSSFVLNIIRIFFESVQVGWPKFKEHDKQSFIRSLVLLLFYGFILYFAIGYLGEKYSNRPMHFLNILLIAISAFIIGFFINLLDEFISAFFSIYFGDKK